LESLKINANCSISGPIVIVMTCICAKLVSVAHANRFINSYWMYICVFLVLYLKTLFLSSLKIMKKSPITEYSDFSSTVNETNYAIRGLVYAREVESLKKRALSLAWFLLLTFVHSIPFYIWAFNSRPWTFYWSYTCVNGTLIYLLWNNYDKLSVQLLSHLIEVA